MKTFLLILLLILSDKFYSQSVTDIEHAGVLRMREEEKMARDVYLTLNEKWQLQVFSHISESEIYHMSRMKTWVDNYKLEDPVTLNEDKTGVFTDQSLQKLYNELISSGFQNKESALRAGAKVEEVDIMDLKKIMNETANADLKNTYQYLVSASENHLRAFVRNLKNLNVTYKPVVMPEKDFNEIISKPMGGMGPGMGRGTGNGKNCPMGCCMN